MLVFLLLIEEISKFLQDERTDVLERALNSLYERLPHEKIWHFANAERISFVKKSIERSLMAQLYAYALYPNGEADQSRDRFLSVGMVASYFRSVDFSLFKAVLYLSSLISNSVD